MLIGSLASFLNGMMLSPYAAAKAAVEALGRPLRVELAPFGASATVAYFGWVDTEMVRDGLDRQQGGKRMQELLPKAFFRRIRPEQAAAALVGGIEERAPRVFAPRWWRYVSALRGLLNPCSTGAWSATRKSTPRSARPRRTARRATRRSPASGRARR